MKSNMILVVKMVNPMRGVIIWKLGIVFTTTVVTHMELRSVESIPELAALLISWLTRAGSSVGLHADALISGCLRRYGKDHHDI
jgi:hypothetical protein